jgi:hypothetical protein
MGCYCVGCQLAQTAPQGNGRGFPEERPVRDGEAARITKSVPACDVREGLCRIRAIPLSADHRRSRTGRGDRL